MEEQDKYFQNKSVEKVVAKRQKILSRRNACCENYVSHSNIYIYILTLLLLDYCNLYNRILFKFLPMNKIFSPNYVPISFHQLFKRQQKQIVLLIY